MRLSHKLTKDVKLTQRGTDILISALRIDSRLDQVPYYRLVSCTGNPGYILPVSRDLFSGLGPGEWPRILVPVLDPGADAGFQGLHAFVHAAWRWLWVTHSRAADRVGCRPRPDFGHDLASIIPAGR
jgi:hypothetical protein